MNQPGRRTSWSRPASADLPKGLICAEGVRWKEHRRFTTAALKSMGMVKFGGNRDALAARVFQGAQRLVDEIGRAPPAPMDAAPLLNHCLGSLVYALVFGKQFERDDPTWLWLQHLQEEGTRMIGVAGPLNFLPWLRFVPKLRRTITFLLEGKNKSHELYRKLLQQHVDSGLQDGDSHLAGRYLKEVALRVRAGDLGTFTEPQMLHSLADVFGAGFDTTNATLKWFLLFMALHPDVQQRVKSELDAAVFSRPEGERNLRMSDLPCCPYTEAAIAETQRLRSVVPTGIPHGATQDVEIGGFRIAAGTMIMPLQWAVHTDPKLWGSDVDSFNPDRFLTPEGRVSKPDYFMPFQSGKRVCLGEELARMMVFAFAASVVFNFRVSFGGGQDAAAVLQGDCGITLNPKAHNLLFEPHLL
ncbi:cytochrome P450 306a1 isoform X2 [Neocloeon triangulifer]|uniref:cytochrome P450 306a1 isoform X2 n=1 Tax=Neocloeon triangulifer TaxID=2078957 RepID=UPI00286F466D|nr:cytochrome P450 306a1 isoform X2 [Neocloeon triangulifer]